MPYRLQMVVAGQRQTALSTNPEFTSRASLPDGFFAEVQQITSFELPDHWIPFYGVGIQFPRGIGRRFFFQDGKHHAQSFHSGDVLVVAPQELRQFRLENGGRFVLLSIEPVVLQEMVGGGNTRSAFELTRTWNGPDQVLQDLILKLTSEINAGHPAGPLLGESICTSIAEQLLLRYSIGRPRLDLYKGGLSGAQLRRTLEYIEECLSDALTGDKIAAVSGLSKYHFGKAFRESTGMNLHGYVLARRIRRAERLLLKSDLSLGMIADAAGFSSQSHFTSVYSARTGIPPGAFRQMKRRPSTLHV